MACSVVAIAAVVLIYAFIFFETATFIFDVGFLNLFTDSGWQPTSGRFNLVPMIAGTVFVASLAVVIGAPIGLSAAIVAHEIRGVKRTVYRRAIELLGGLPSVVIGLWGLTAIVPLILKIEPPGASLLAGGVVLSIMIIPTIALVSLSAIENVNPSTVDAAHALGLSRWSVLWRVVIPQARGGLFAGVVLGVGRAVGETMAVLMVCGNVVQVPSTVFEPVRTLTANIALEMAYAMDTHRAALFTTGFILLVGVAIFVTVAKFFDRRSRVSTNPWLPAPIGPMWSPLSKVATTLFGLVPLFALVWVVGGVAVSGFSEVDLEFLFSIPKDAGRSGGIAPILVSTLLVVGIAVAATTIMGLTTAIVLAELQARWVKFRGVVRICLDVLAGVPSIVFGLFGYAFFGVVLGMGFSILSGALTLSFMMLPFFVRVVEEGLRQVPTTFRDAGYALGMRPVSVTFRIVLPMAKRAVGVGLVLSLARAMAETAALLFTSGYVDRYPDSLLDSGRVLSIHIYDLAMNVPGGMARANGSALVLVVLLVLINISIMSMFRRTRRS